MTIGLDPLQTIRGGLPLDQYKASLGEYLGQVASDAWESGPLSAGTRLLRAASADEEARGRGETLLSSEQATEQGKPLGLRFDEPIAQGAFNVLAEEKRRQVAAQTTFQRARVENGYGTLHWLLAGGTEFLAQAADPLNIAAAFVPVVGEARYATMAARLGALPATLIKGAVEGAAGQALLEPITALDQRAQGDDYSMLNTLLDVGFGGALGVALHGAHYGIGAGFRFMRDRFAPSERAAPNAALPHETVQPNPVAEERPTFERVDEPPPRQPVAEHMEQLRPETKDTAMRTAVSQLLQDKPVDIEPVLAADPAWPEVKAAIEDLQAHQALQAQAVNADAPTFAVPADFRASDEEIKLARRVVRGWQPEKPLDAPTSLTDFVRSAGGLREGTAEAKELMADDTAKTVRGLVSDRGRQADHLAQAATEAGYRVGKETRTGSGVDVDGFLRALSEDASGVRQHLPDDEFTAAWHAQQDYFSEFARSLKDAGIEPRGMSPRELAYLLRQDPHTQRLMVLAREIEHLGNDASLELVARLDAERAALEREILSEPGLDTEDMAVDHREFPAATLKELENYYADIERTAEPDQEGRRAAQPGPAGGRAAEGGEPAATGPAGRGAAAEAAGLRQRAEGAQGAAARSSGVAGDVSPEALARFAERQQTADLHADPTALADRDARLGAQAREAAQLLQDDLAAYGHLLDADERALFEATATVFDDETKAIDALAACQMRGA